MQKSYIFIDIDTKSQIDASGAFITKSSEYVTIERGQWQVLCMQFVRRIADELGTVTLQPVDLSGSSFVLVADNDFDDTSALMFKSLQSTTAFDETNPESNRFNIQGDWVDDSTADLTQGQMSFRVNADTTKFNTVLNGKKTATAYFNVKQYTSGLANPSTIAWIPFIAQNTIRDWSSAEEIPPEGIDLVTYVNAYFNGGVEFQFSVNGVSDWHTTQTSSDRYYRQRVAGTEASWSPSVMMPVGEGGGSGSGMTEAEIKEYVDQQVEAKFEELANAEW